MITLTERQQDALRFIIGFKERNGISPSMREIARGIGLSENTMGHVQRLLDCLEQRGAIRRQRFISRSIEVLERLPIPRAPDGEPLHFIRIGGEV